MDGRTHAIVGGVVGGVVALNAGHSVVSVGMATIVVASVAAALMPDLDINGKLSGKIIVPYKYFRRLFILVSLLLILYSFIEAEDLTRYLGILIGGSILIITRYTTQRKMLTITGVAIFISGVLFSKFWIILVGIYIVAASKMGHRTYTHSLLGLFYFSYMALQIEAEYQIAGLFPALVIAYVSHLFLDTKLFNKQGIQLIRPFSKFEI